MRGEGEKHGDEINQINKCEKVEEDFKLLRGLQNNSRNIITEMYCKHKQFTRQDSAKSAVYYAEKKIL